MTNLGDLLRGAGFEDKGTAPEPATPEAKQQAVFGPKIVVRKSRKGRGGKTVTEVQGVLSDRAGQAKALKKSLGVGAHVDGELLIVQGDQVDRVCRWLETQGVKKVVRG